MSVKKSLRSYVEDLFSKNTDYKYPEQAINQAESLKSLSSDLYTDNIRFIYELIQNADDAQAIHVILAIVDNKYLIIAHDGKSFDEKDLQGLCGVNNGTKKKDLDKTGYKGLGFKAVFGKSNYVLIYSDEEYFRFDSSYAMKWNKQWGTNDQQTWERENDRQFIYPWQINPIWTSENEVPSPLKNFLSLSETHINVANIILLNNLEEIRLAIDQLKQQAHMFLFLRNISQMIFISQSTNTITIARDSNYGLKKVYFDQKVISQWIIKRWELDIPDDIREKLAKDSKVPEKLRFIKKAEMFFAAKYKDGGTIEKLHDKESHLFSYLPTKIVDYIFPIIINANFLTNVNREQIHTDSTWNQWLFGNIGRKLFEWIKELVVKKQFHFQAYKLLPTKLNLTNNTLSKQFNEAFDWSVQHCNFILNRNKQLLTVNEVIMDSTSMSEQSSFIHIDSMRQYVIDYYKRSHFDCAEHPFINYDSNLSGIGVRHFTWHNCIEMFQSNQFLQTHSIEENKQMIEYFYSKYSQIDGADNIDIPLEQIPFLMDQNNRLQLIKDIYFPAETIGDSEPTDSKDFFLNKIIFDWLNEYKQIRIKNWLKDLGMTEKTDLTYLHKTILPNASTYITPENAITTIQMLFMLYEKHHIDKNDLNQLKQLKLLTRRGTFIPAGECFFSKKYSPRLPIAELLAKLEDKFLSSDYLRNETFNCELNDIFEWYRFFTALGVHDEFCLVDYQQKLTIPDAIQCGFNREYLSRTSPNGRRQADGYSGLKTITFLKHTTDNWEFAELFWSYVIEKMNPNDFQQYSTRVYWRSSFGTEMSNVDFIPWFVKNINCIPTTLGNCQSSTNIYLNTNEIKELCSTYMPVVSISSKFDLTKWISFFNFKTKLTFNDYLQLLDQISKDERNLANNQDRIQHIYSYLLNECHSWTIDKQNFIQTQVKTLYLLTENNQWKLPTDLYVYLQDNQQRNCLNDVIPCLKLNLKNKRHPQLKYLLKFFQIKPISMKNMRLVEKNSSPATKFREKLIEILPFMKKWLTNLMISIETLDQILQQEMEFIESESLELFYKENSVQEINVYFDRNQQQFYITQPWNSETTLMELPKKLCQILNIPGFETEMRFLLKAQKKEIIKYFKKYSIPIPTDDDIIQLNLISRSEIIEHLTPILNTDDTSSNESISDQDEENSEDTKTYIRKSQDDEYLYTKRVHQNSSDDYDSIHLLPKRQSRRRSNKRKRMRLSTSNKSFDGTFNHLDLIDLSTISNSSSSSIKTSFNRQGLGGNGERDRYTGLTGEQMVYEYLKRKYSSQSDSVSIQWFNENSETSLPYDILLTENGIKHYIEVKATRSINQHTFFISINQIKAILHNEDNYHIYRVYLKQKKLFVLNNIQSRLKDKNQLALLLTMNPNSLDQAIFTEE